MKTNATHTAGPWQWEHNVDSSRAIVIAPDSADQGIIGTVNLCRGGSQPDGEANARLIAAAPELRDALERLTRIAAVELKYTRPDLIDAMLRLIARIDGSEGDR